MLPGPEIEPTPESTPHDDGDPIAETRELIARSAALRKETTRLAVDLRWAALDAMNRANAINRRHDVTERRILIVDDERTTSETLAFIFSREGYDARYARSAEEATQIMLEWIPEFTLIDVMLPRVNGIPLAVAITADHPNCRILLFTGDLASAELLMSQNNRTGDFEILQKPVHPTVLLETACRLLRSGEPSSL